MSLDFIFHLSQVMSLDVNCASKISASLHMSNVSLEGDNGQDKSSLMNCERYEEICSDYCASKISASPQQLHLSIISVEGDNGQDKTSLMNGARYDEICSDIKINSMSEPKRNVSFLLIATILAVLFNVQQFHAQAATKTENYDDDELNDVVPTMKFGCGDYKLSRKLIKAFFGFNPGGQSYILCY